MKKRFIFNINKWYQAEPMTCKEFVEKRFPGEYTDLLKLCPFNFGLSVIPYPCKVQVAERDVREKLCSICWNQPAKHHGKWIMKVKVYK